METKTRKMRIPKALVLLASLLAAIGLATAFGQEQNKLDEDNGRRSLFVDAAAPLNGDGTREHPFVRITDAVVRARALRQEDGNDNEQRQENGDDQEKRIVIHVAPGTYVGSYTNTGPRIEPLPIRLDVPRLKLLGSTSMERDESGLPTGVIEPGSNTLLLADPPLAGMVVQSLLLVASTSDEVVDRVTIAKLSLDTRAPRLSGGDINFDRAQDFTFRDNYVTAGMGGQMGGGKAFRWTARRGKSLETISLEWVPQSVSRRGMPPRPRGCWSAEIVA